MKLTKTVVTGSVLALAFLANCDLILGPDWKYGEAEMRSAVEGTWKLTRKGEAITLVAKQATSAQHSERERGLVKAAAACGNRSFVKQAAACIDSTRMPLELIANGHQVKEANLIVDGTTFRTGRFWFYLDDASVEAEIDPTGAVTQLSMYARSEQTGIGERIEATLARVAK